MDKKKVERQKTSRREREGRKGGRNDGHNSCRVKTPRPLSLCSGCFFLSGQLIALSVVCVCVRLRFLLTLFLFIFLAILLLHFPSSPFSSPSLHKVRHVCCHRHYRISSDRNPVGFLFIELQYCSLLPIYGVVKKKVNHKREEKMHSKVKMTLQRAENLVHVQQHHGKHFYKKIFF